MRGLVIDHYDSFTCNIDAWLRSADGEVGLDFCAITEAKDLESRRVQAEYDFLILSPGPHRPSLLPEALRFAQSFLGELPILGICLGHQIICHIHGLEVKRTLSIRHGMAIEIEPLLYSTDSQYSHTLPHPLFKGCSVPLEAGSYNSLVVSEPPLGCRGTVIARCDQGEIQGIDFSQKYSLPTLGLQFHPESFLTKQARQLAKNWLDIVGNCS